MSQLTSSPIPKRLIQTAKTADLPLLGRAAVTSLRLLNPDFEYCFFDDRQVAAFVATEFPQYREVFDNFAYPIQRFDFFRYLAVYRLGGFYLDTDVFLARGLEDLRSSGCVFPFEELTLNQYLRQTCHTDWELGNYAFGCHAGHPLLERIIENCVRAQRQPEFAREMLASIPRWFHDQFAVLHTTGPGLITRTLFESPELQASLTVLFPHDVCEPESWHQFGDFGIHFMAGSWRPRIGYGRDRLARLWENWRRSKLNHQSQLLGPHRPGPWTARYPEPLRS